METPSLEDSQSASTAVVARSFQRGTNFETFDQARFDAHVVPSIREVLSSNRVALLVVVTCGGGEDGMYAEHVENGESPTTRAVAHAFSDEVRSGRVETRICSDWGANAGSTAALNEGLVVAQEKGVEFLMCWSPELKMSPERIALSLSHVERHELDVCGFLRALHWLKPQWQVPQNTAAVWRVKSLAAVNGFNSDLADNGTETVSTLEFGDVPLRGMEDYECILRMHKHDPEGPRLGMVGRSSPLLWDLSFKKPGTPEFDDNFKKIARQWEVMKAYTHKYFPGEPFEDVFLRIMERMQFD